MRATASYLRDPATYAASYDRARAAVLVAAGALLAYAGAEHLVRGNVLALAGVVAIAAAVLVLEKPRAATLLMLVLSAPLVRQLIVPLSFGGITTDAFELMAYALVFWWVISRGRAERMPSWELAGPVLLLVAGATVGSVYGLMHGGSRYLVLGQYKSYLVYLLVLPLSTLFATHEQKARLERWVVGFCAVGSVVVLVAAAIGSDLPSEAPELPLNTFGVTTVVQRIRPSMLWLLFLATLLVLGRVFAYGMTPRSATYLTLFTLVWVFSFNRSSWGALIVCGALLALLRPGERRPGRMLRTLAIGALVLPALLSLAGAGAFGTTAKAVPARLESLVSRKVVAEDAIQDRAAEYPVAIAAIKHSPVFGVGVGRPYGARRPTYDSQLGVVVYEDRPFSHNSFLFAYLQTGLLGVAALALLGLNAWRATVRALRTLPEPAALRILVGGLALLGYGIQSVSQTSLLHRPGITAAAVAIVFATTPRVAAEAA
jgi:O-antigen ligase